METAWSMLPFLCVPISDLLWRSLRAQSNLIRHENKPQYVALPLLSYIEILLGCFSVSAKAGEDSMETNLYVLYRPAERGRTERQKGINIAELAAGSDRYKLSIWVQGGRVCVSVCVEKSGEGSCRLSKANRKASLPQVQLLCVRREGDDKKEGGVIIRAREMRALFFRQPLHGWAGRR